MEAMTAEAFYGSKYPDADKARVRGLPRAHQIAAADRVAVTILTYARPDYLRATLNSFHIANVYRNLHVTVLDQGRCEATRAFILAAVRLGRVHGHITLADNVGPAEGRNRLLAAVPDDCPYVFHLEDDWQFTVGGNWLTMGIRCLKELAPLGVQMIRYRYKASDNPASNRINIAGTHKVLGVPVLVAEPGHFSNTPNLATMESYRECGAFADPKHEWRYDKAWKAKGYRWAQFARVCHHIGATSAFTQADSDTFDGGTKMHSGATREASEGGDAS